MDKIVFYINQFVFIIYIIFEIIILLFSLWTSNLLKVLFYIRFIAVFILSIGSIIYPIIGLKCSIHFIVMHNVLFNYCKNIFKDLSLMYSIVLSTTRILDSFNEKNYNEYIKNCPFTLNSESIYEKRRCELLTITNNTQYKYQYICSYNASKDFNGDTTKEGLDKIICKSELNNINENNEIISKFKKIYNNKNNNDTNIFYCCRIDAPEKNKFIKDEYCNKENKYNNLIRWIKIIGEFLIIIISRLNKRLNNNITNRVNYFIGVLDPIINALEEEERETEYDEENENNVSFNEEEDENIILENHNIFNVGVNIKEFIKNEEKQKID